MNTGWIYKRLAKSLLVACVCIVTIQSRALAGSVNWYAGVWDASGLNLTLGPNLTLGDNTVRRFNGILDELSSMQEIQLLYHTARPGRPAASIAYNRLTPLQKQISGLLNLSRFSHTGN